MSLKRPSRVFSRKLPCIFYEWDSKYRLSEISKEVWLYFSNASNISTFKCTCPAKESFLPSLSYQHEYFRNF